MSAITKIKLLAPLLALLPSFLNHPAAPPREPPIVTILCYHTFDSAIHTPYTVTSRRFKEQMRYLYVQKIPVISMATYLDHLEKKTPLPERSVIITIDDGYRTAKTIAWPILKQYGFPFTVYVYPHAISRFPTSLTWDEVREMSKGGVDMESHSMTHPLLTHPGKAMNRPDYQAWLEEELQGSKLLLEKEIGKPVTSLAYPYGGYDENVIERVRLAGYKTALTCDDGDVTSATPPLQLNRRLIFRQTSVKSFVQAFRSKPILVEGLSPRDGERVKDIPKEIRAKILNLSTIRPETAQILVDKLGQHWKNAPINPQTGELSYTVPQTTRRGYYFVSLSALDKLDPSIRRETSWLFIIKQNVSKR